MIKRSYRYIKQLIDVQKLLDDFDNRFLLVSQRKYNGKIVDGKVITPEGVSVTVQILTDRSDPVVNKNTGKIMDDNKFETFDVTILGASYPLPLKKGDIVSFHDFESDSSYYVDFNLILRFKGIEKVEE